MCLPVAAIASMASGLFGVVGSVIEANAQAKVYETQAQAARQNARLAELQGIRELEKGAREEHRLRQQGRQFRGTQRAALAGSGGQMSGSALNVLADTAMGIEEDATVLRYNTLQDKYTRDVQAVSFRNEANAAETNAKNAKSQAIWGGFKTLLGMGMDAFGAATEGNVPTGATIKRGGGITLAQRQTITEAEKAATPFAWQSRYYPGMKRK